MNIAVAGGTGGVGRTIVDVLRDNPRYQAIILSRTIRDGVDLSAPVIAVDYDDVEALQAVLEKRDINTVISALALHIIGAGQAQINLIKAAEKSDPTKRFVTSTWAVRPEAKYFDLFRHGFQHVESYAELEKTQLEWTAFNVGWFTEYYAMPHVETYIPQSTFVVDMANRHASIPGDGKQKMTFTYSKDVAKFVVVALSLPKWDRDTYAIGDKLTWEEFVKIAEEARGGEKFTVTYDSVEKLRAGQVTELPGQVAAYSYFPKEWAQRLFSAFGIWVTESVFDFPDEKLLNRQFPDIKVTTVREMLQSAWKGK
ncbi:hypothetical protein N0V84_007526 [Fusarium piperis]|uniref:NAD(P)-binding domain-containing protein n=1 Tax=Fusarium piperis TaxID=1435070 RepID=A0A9W8W9U8_9HYPO|nr:hypothetical protein N0V84_007526 [Fusarium piperis]